MTSHLSLRLTLFFLVAYLILLLTPSYSQEHKHPPQDALIHERFYSTWMRPDNRDASCCDKQDCYPTEVRRVKGHWEAKRREDGQWVAIPPEKVENDRDNPDGNNHVCMTPPDEHNNSTVFCFIVGGGT